MWCILISYPEIFLIQYIIDPTMNVVVQDLTEDIFLKGGSEGFMLPITDGWT